MRGSVALAATVMAVMAGVAVADPKGGYGAGFWTLPDGQDPAALAAGDPAIKAEAGFRYEIAPMPALVLGQSAAANQSGDR